MTEHIIFDVNSEAETAHFGHALAAVLPVACTVALNGTLGAGKTRLVQAIAEAVGVDRRDVVSPTFVLVQEYHGSRTIIHVDAYRLKDEDEFRQLGGEEYLAGAYVVLIEWADRISGCLPDDYLEIAIEVVGETARRLTLIPHGPASEIIVAQLQGSL
jgi:tRNA threonylcarbamoyladenosine biosynthesis protein TsaE